MVGVGTAAGPRTLAIDIGGSGLKMMTLGPSGAPLNDRSRRKTPTPPTPPAVLTVLQESSRNSTVSQPVSPASLRVVSPLLR